MSYRDGQQKLLIDYYKRFLLGESAKEIVESSIGKFDRQYFSIRLHPDDLVGDCFTTSLLIGMYYNMLLPMRISSVSPNVCWSIGKGFEELRPIETIKNLRKDLKPGDFIAHKDVLGHQENYVLIEKIGFCWMVLQGDKKKIVFVDDGSKKLLQASFEEIKSQEEKLMSIEGWGI